MKERLVDDWLTRINERGYQTAFGQVLAAQGFRVLRIGHSAYEHGKDVLAIALSGYDYPSDVRIAKLTGFDHHLSKPCDCRQLRALLETKVESRL